MPEREPTSDFQEQETTYITPTGSKNGPAAGGDLVQAKTLRTRFTDWEVLQP
jgi:hypothetical protein